MAKAALHKETDSILLVLDRDEAELWCSMSDCFANGSRGREVAREIKKLGIQQGSYEVSFRFEIDGAHVIRDLIAKKV